MAGIVGLTELQHTNGTNAMTINSAGAVAFGNTHNLQFFRINSDLTSATSATLVTNYTDAHDSYGFKRVGSAWSVSSGVFTPSAAGLYEITLVACLRATSNNRYIQFNLMFSTNSGGSFTTDTMYTHSAHLNSGTTYSTVTFPRYYNVTDASTFRFKLQWLAEGTNITLAGTDTQNNESAFVFKRLADAQ